MNFGLLTGQLLVLFLKVWAVFADLLVSVWKGEVFPSRGTTDILGPMSLCCWGCSVHCWVFYQPGLYSLEASSTPSSTS